MSRFGRKRKIFFINYIDRLIDRVMKGFSSEIVIVGRTAKKYAEKNVKREINLIFNGIDKENIRSSN